MIDLTTLIDTLEGLGLKDADLCVLHLKDAMADLSLARAAMDEIPVSGRNNVDKLYGCMLALDLITGGEHGRQSDR